MRTIITAAACMGMAAGTAAGQCEPDAGVKLLASDGAADDRFGRSVDISGLWAVVGAPEESRGGLLRAGAAYVYELRGGVWVQRAKLTPSDAADEDQFGYSVAIDGDRVVVGSRFDGDDDRGSAYVFRRNDGAWSQEVKLVGGGTVSAGDELGVSVDISGTRVIVGAWGDDDRGAGAGAAHVFERIGNAWFHVQQLLALDGASGDAFGISVAIDGDRALIGARGEDQRGLGAGAAYVFNRQANGDWWQHVKLTAPDGEASDQFGQAVALSGGRAAVCSWLDDSRGTNAGSVHVFVEVEGGWYHQDMVIALDGTDNDRFGGSVAIDGDTLAVGADVVNDGGTDTGAAYIFRRSGPDWIQRARLTASDADPFDWFGGDVALSGDRLIAGAIGQDDRGDSAGAAYVFELGCECPADFNGDGALDSDDFFDFLNAFNAVEVGADFNGDGVIDSDDFFDFLNAFNAGC